MISLRVLDIVAGLVLSSVVSPNRMFPAQDEQMGKREAGKLLKKKTFNDERMKKVGKN
jgi:hypothetical protein